MSPSIPLLSLPRLLLLQYNVSRATSGGTGGTAELRDVWEAGAFHLDRLQAAEECVNAEQAVQASRQPPTWTLPYTPTFTPDSKLQVWNHMQCSGLVCCPS